ncbi:cupin domain-containing protein [Homoserinibacter sp. YIM 151385]|uniref:cupin domain-containing protein n=1 Tax=Homoserinibacter sp. YIM 151385 TaxID=2985506 RepID=UPI0022F103E9|nr:cupin domain-containing protein [Homoserinibacter sp. YIM 151385]WBU37463.1 cupin domain-containing protein [Homoserinibacter sp. YIM 151385]
MIIIPPHRQAGIAGKPGSQFSGDAYPYLTMPATDGVTINTVDFTPGARTHWHRHEQGQIIQVLAGRGRIQSEGGPVEVLRAGDVVWVPGGERHWHGAAADSFLVHTAISLGVTSWEQPVADEEYAAPAAGEDEAS